MIYIYKKNGQIVSQRDIRPQTGKVIELKRMIPKPVKDGYDAILNADFDTLRVWFDLLPTFDEVKKQKITEITTYDKSEEINSFTIQGVKIWLDKEMRTGLKLRFDAEKASGSLNTTLWYGTIKVPLEVNTAIGLLLQVELYASVCYDTTQQHIANVMNLTTIEEVTEYDFTANYPDKLVF